MSNTGSRFQRVATGLRRNIFTGELWHVGRSCGKIKWRRLGTTNRKLAQLKISMLGVNGDYGVYQVKDGAIWPSRPEQHGLLIQPAVAQAGSDAPLPPASSPPAVPPGVDSESKTACIAPCTLRDFMSRWRLGKGGLSAGTIKKLDSHVVMTAKYLDLDREVGSYTAQDIREAVAKARSELKGQTINESILRLLRNAFDLAVEEKNVPENPISRIKKEKATPIKRQQLSWVDANRVLEAVKKSAPESYLILRTMLFLGVGPAECEGWTGGTVDWVGKKISFIRRKTGQPFEVPIFPWTEDFIRELEPRLRNDGPVFVWRNPRKALQTACTACGFAQFEMRSLRRTLIVHLLEQGIDPRLVASWQGHQDATLIFKVYGKNINASHEQAQLAKLSAGVAGK